MSDASDSRLKRHARRGQALFDIEPALHDAMNAARVTSILFGRVCEDTKSANAQGRITIDMAEEDFLTLNYAVGNALRAAQEPVRMFEAALRAGDPAPA